MPTGDAGEATSDQRGHLARGVGATGLEHRPPGRSPQVDAGQTAGWELTGVPNYYVSRLRALLADPM
jgi:hypothetical protein